MKVFSAAEAISPAIDRTRLYLFHPFEWGTFLKLCLVACITEGMTGSFNGSHGFSNSPTHSGTPNFDIPPVAVVLIVAAVLACFVLGVVLCYLVTRLRFSFFDCLVRKTKLIGPAWSRCSEQAMRFFLA